MLLCQQRTAFGATTQTIACVLGMMEGATIDGGTGNGTILGSALALPILLTRCEANH